MKTMRSLVLSVYMSICLLYKYGIFLPPDYVAKIIICKRALFNWLKQTSTYIKIVKNIAKTNPNVFQVHMI